MSDKPKANILSENTRRQLEAMKLDTASNFLSGQDTSPFSKNALAATAGVGASAVVGVGTGVQSAALMATITAECFAYIQKEAMERVANATVKILTIPMEKIASASADFVSKNVLSISDIQNELVKGIDEVADAAAEKAKNVAKSALQSDIGQKVSDINNKITKQLTDCQSAINKISTYTTKGPEWMENNLARFAYTTLSGLDSFLNKEVQSADEEKTQRLTSIGEQEGAKIANETNTKAKKAAKSTMDNIDQQKQKVQSKAKALVSQAVMKIKGLLGG